MISIESPAQAMVEACVPAGIDHVQYLTEQSHILRHPFKPRKMDLDEQSEDYQNGWVRAGNEWFVYDENGYLIQISRSDRVIEQWSYDSQGFCTTHTILERNGRGVSYQYDYTVEVEGRLRSLIGATVNQFTVDSSFVPSLYEPNLSYIALQKDADM